MTNFTIQIISDTVCPVCFLSLFYPTVKKPSDKHGQLQWCYIGHRRLSRAIQAHKTSHPNDTFSLAWHAFYLNPSAPGYPGIEKRAHYQAKFGEGRADALYARLAQAGDQEGVGFRFGGRTGKTKESHRVIWFAGVKQREGGEGKEQNGERGLQTRVVEELFRAYFEEEKNITDQKVLVDAATGAGMDREEVVKMLESDLGGAEVDEEAERAKRRLVTGVPYFTVQGRYAVEGAEESDVFLDIFNRIKENEKS